MNAKRYLSITFLSITLVSLEIIWTRIFSAEFFYTFAFLIISLTILGMGLGSLALRLFQKLSNPDRLWVYLSLTGLFAMTCPPAAVKLGMQYSQLFSNPLMILKFVATVIILGLPFFFGGMVLGIFFKSGHKEMPKLYMADLIGAGAGVVISVLLMNTAGTLNAVFLAALPALLAALLMGKRLNRLIPIVLIALPFIALPFSSQLLEKQREERAPVIYTHWDAMAKIKLYEYSELYRGINIDNAANSPVYKFDGDWNKPDSLKFEFGISIENLIKRFDNCTFMSLGAGGGGDVVQALQYGATKVHAVEVNPHINDLLKTGMLADYSGQIYNDPRVIVATEDARTYVRRHKNTFDVIFSLSSNTFAALASGSFALAENYLFTVEAFEDYYTALSDSGFMMMEHQFYMPRMTSEVILALQNLGIENPKDYFCIYDLPQMRRNVLLLSKKPLTEDIRQNALGTLTAENYPNIHLLYPSPDSTADNLVNRVVQEGWKSVQPDANINLSPCTDNRPFTAQLGMWKNLDRENLDTVQPWEFKGFPLSKMLIVIILAVITILVIPLNLLPFIKRGSKMGFSGWLYFFAIGVAFMVVEIVLIQRYTLLIGPSSYTFVTILFTILIGSGIGSRYSTKFNSKTPFIAILLLIAFEILIAPFITGNLVGLGMTARMLFTAILILPLSFFMGMPFPKGGIKAGESIDWGFAVNGAASVLGSTAIMLVSFSYGFISSMCIGAAFYLLAMGMLNVKKGW